MPTSSIRTFDIMLQDDAVAAVPVVALATTTFNATLDAALSPDPALTSNAEGVIVQPDVEVAVGTSLRVKAIYQGMVAYHEVITE